MANGIPVLDFACFPSKDTKNEAVEDLTKKLHSAFCEVGFVYLKNHGISAQLLEKVHDVSQTFFNLEVGVKNKYLRQGDSNHGWVSFALESLNPSRGGDLKEAFNVTPASANIWPEIDVPEFQAVVMDFYKECHKLMGRILVLMARALQLEEDFFEKVHHQPTNRTTLRCLHYPPLTVDMETGSGQIRCGEHSDYGSITILFQDSSGGLEVMNRRGEYQAATPVEGTVVVNIGDLMQRWTGDVYISTKHRVVLPMTSTKTIRQSFAFFGHPDDDCVINCINNTNKYKPVTSKEYLFSRFGETYVD